MKRLSTSLLTLASLFVILCFSSCVKDEITSEYLHYTQEEYAMLTQVLDLPLEREDYSVKLPSHMLQHGQNDLVLDNAKATLGRVLFYDKKLSRNNKVSCASCHHQELGFSDSKPFSEGFNGELTKRNSLALASVPNFEASYKGNGNFSFNQAAFFWDERAESISQQSRMTIEDNIEMGMSIHVLSDKLEEEAYYRLLFRKAFGSEEITPQLITESLQEFINAFVSVDSRFDEGMNKHGNPFSPFNNFSLQENNGKMLFIDHCSSCHGTNMSTVVERAANNGLDEVYADSGIAGITYAEHDRGRFKVPFLRNIELTGPYMHDGRFETLEEVVDHYSEGIANHENLDFRLRNPSDFTQPIRMNFSDNEKQELVAFLKTLTDNTLLYDQRFSDPFK